MTIVQMITKEMAGERWRLLLMATLAGAGNAIILVIVSIAASAPNDVSTRLVVMFLLAVALFIIGARYTYHRTTALIERALHRIRTRILAKIKRTELEPMERIGAPEVMDRITENITVISDSAGLIAHLLQSLCIIAFATFYLAWQSFTAFLLLALMIVAGAAIYLSRQRVVEDFLQEASAERLTFFERLTDMLKGFKEIKFSRRRAQEIHVDVVKSSDAMRRVTTKTNDLFNDNNLFATCNQFALLGVLVFVLPRYTTVTAAEVGTLVAGLLFMWGPMAGIVSGFPAYIRSSHALQQVEVLEKKLDVGAREAPSIDAAKDPWGGRFTKIEARELEYLYPPEDGAGSATFCVGPVNLSIEAGEILFIVGGNGSGKSTLVKVLTGLYPATSGALRVDGVVVDASNRASLREMFSAIFSDFHLFSKLYGLLDADPAAVSRLLAKMQIDDKTSFADDRFTRRNLSTGQRKRLAMVVVLLEDRPIYLFDEWAADQDPEFRQYFYEELLPELKKRGKTVIAVTHDDRYFRRADRVVTMEYGKLRSIERFNAQVAAPGGEGTIAGSP